MAKRQLDHSQMNQRMFDQTRRMPRLFLHTRLRMRKISNQERIAERSTRAHRHVDFFHEYLRAQAEVDKGDSEKVRQQIRDEGALPVIPNRSNATRKAYCPKRFYRRRHKIENFFCRIKDWRRIATRYDKLARNFLAATTLVGALYWIKL